ncbi:hypothetical protein [Rhodococcus erythropolis]|uniref:hypothetical protein n=1 Tax=Rhodococcus erythropolis TaxID=1833 RepID=UPI0011126C44|nr:hypothetical protein [Rhodococcus erythropolis]
MTIREPNLVVLLRESVSNKNTPFAALVRELGDRIEPQSVEKSQVAVSESEYQPQRRLSGTELASMIDVYRSGQDSVRGSQVFGIHRQTVTRLLVKHGVPVHPRATIDAKLLAEQTWHYERGKSTVELGRRYNLAESSVVKALKKSGVQLRAPKFNRWAKSE